MHVVANVNTTVISIAVSFTDSVFVVVAAIGFLITMGQIGCLLPRSSTRKLLTTIITMFCVVMLCMFRTIMNIAALTTLALRAAR